MGRNLTRNTQLSLDTISIIRRLYPRHQTFWEKHMKDSEFGLQYFYTALRHDMISSECEQLIESSLEYDLRHLGVDRDDIAYVEALSPINELLNRALEVLMKTAIPPDVSEDDFRSLLLQMRLTSIATENSKRVDELRR